MSVTKVTTWQAQLVKMDKICIKREAVVSLWYTKKICPIFTQRRYLAVLPACPFPFLFCKQWAQENREVHTYTHTQTQAKYHFHIQLMKMSNDQFLSQKSIEFIILK